MKEKLTIVKVGGDIIDDELKMKEFITAFSKLEEKKVLVHGGGKIASKMASDLGIESNMVEGRRITGDKMIDVTVMVYAGLVNKKIVAALFTNGVNCMGLSGADANCILSDKRPAEKGIDYGWVGDIKEVNSAFIYSLIKEGITPVFCALTHDGLGNMLNTNADTIACEIAVALSNRFEVSLNYCFELPGVLKDIGDSNSLIKELSSEHYSELKNEGIISGGMIPKLDNAFNAIERGVSKVNIRNVVSLEGKEVNHEYTRLY